MPRGHRTYAPNDNAEPARDPDILNPASIPAALLERYQARNDLITAAGRAIFIQLTHAPPKRNRLLRAVRDHFINHIADSIGERFPLIPNPATRSPPPPSNVVQAHVDASQAEPLTTEGRPAWFGHSHNEWLAEITGFRPRQILHTYQEDATVQQIVYEVNAEFYRDQLPPAHSPPAYDQRDYGPVPSPPPPPPYRSRSPASRSGRLHSSRRAPAPVGTRRRPSSRYSRANCSGDRYNSTLPRARAEAETWTWNLGSSRDPPLLPPPPPPPAAAAVGDEEGDEEERTHEFPHHQHHQYHRHQYGDVLSVRPPPPNYESRGFVDGAVAAPSSRRVHASAQFRGRGSSTGITRTTGRRTMRRSRSESRGLNGRIGEGERIGEDDNDEVDDDGELLPDAGDTDAALEHEYYRHARGRFFPFRSHRKTRTEQVENIPDVEDDTEDMNEDDEQDEDGG